METRLAKDKGETILQRCGFWNGWEHPREGLSGGLLVGWLQNLKLDILYSSKHLIHANLLDFKGNPLSITFVYGHPVHAKRMEVWNELKYLQNMAHRNWLCIGDFNQVLGQEDKFSFTDRRIEGADTFNQFLFDLGLCELEAKGQRYTWMNGRENEAFVMERLDKAYASIDWINSYPHYAMQNHPILRSDHGSILLDFELQQPFRKRPFRFERMWLTHTECKEIMESAWKTHSVGSRAFKLQQKLKSVRKQLGVWNKTVFGKIDKEIKDKQLELQHLQNTIHTVEDVKKERDLIIDLENLMEREEIMWAQKVRSN